VASSGPDHDKRFTADVFVDEKLYGSGSGRSKKEAEYNAAREALGRLAEGISGTPLETDGDPEEGGRRARAS
jgi:ribonuclease-3